MQPKILLAKDTIDKADFDALAAWLLIYPRLTKGNLTIEFEEKWAKKVKSEYAVFVNSGSSANLLMLYALIAGNKLKNKKIVIPAISWITDIAPVIQFGLEPILCDINTYDLSVNLTELERIFSYEKPSCLLLVSVLGLVPHMQAVIELCNRYDVILLEDICEGLGSSYENRSLGNWGLMATTSLYYGHHLSTIEGGMITTDNKEMYDLLKMLRSHGWDRDLDPEIQTELRESHKVDEFNIPYTFYHPGFNVRSTDLQAFIGLRQLDKFDNVVSRRNTNYNLYNKYLENHYWKPADYTNRFVSNLGYPIIHPFRDEIARVLVANGVECRPLISGSMGTQPFFKRLYGEKYMHFASVLDKRGLYVPNHPYLLEEEIQYICSLINRVILEKPVEEKEFQV